MFTTIVVGTDGSDPAGRAVLAAAELAERSGIDRVHVVAGYHPIPAGELFQIAHELPREFRNVVSSDTIGADHCGAAALVLEHHGIKAVEHPVAGDGAEAILDVAADVGADLIVVGSRCQGLGRRMLRGSVSTKVCHHAPCSVLVVQDRAHAVVPDDGAPRE